MKRIIVVAGKVIGGAMAYFAGLILGSILAQRIGLSTPPLPSGADAATLVQFQLITSPIFAGTLALVSSGLAVGFPYRWLILTIFSWTAYSWNTYLEAGIFATNAAATYTLVMHLCAVVFCSAVIAWFFPSADKESTISAKFTSFAAQYAPTQWVWRLLAAFLAFPLVYVMFGSLARPFIIGYYEQHMAGLTIPGWAEILPTLFVRSLFFLLASMPLLIVWQRSRLSLLVTLGTALFILVGGLYMLQSYWYPATMRMVHSLEILADSFVYAGVMVTLLTRKQHRLMT